MFSIVIWDRAEADAKLKNQPQGTFLVRWSDRTHSYVLSYNNDPIRNNIVHLAYIMPMNGKGSREWLTGWLTGWLAIN